MTHGISLNSIIPMRAEPAHKSEMVSQLLFGELYEVLFFQGKWLRIKCKNDGYEGWIDKIQAHLIDENEQVLLEESNKFYAGDLVQMISKPSQTNWHQLVVQGSSFYSVKNDEFNILQENYHYPGLVVNQQRKKEKVLEFAFSYLNAPYLWGGRTPFGIDCSGFTQIVYMLCGYQLPRDAKDQAKLGETLSFIEEAEPGDLAFFDNEEGNIVHAGIIMQDNYIIHASGKVRIDRLDQYGIANNELKTHSHRLRVMKRMF